MSLCACAIAAVTAASLVTSTFWKRAAAPSALAAAWPAASFTSISVTCAPAPTSRCATALPSPEAPPVMTARI